MTRRSPIGTKYQANGQSGRTMIPSEMYPPVIQRGKFPRSIGICGKKSSNYCWIFQQAMAMFDYQLTPERLVISLVNMISFTLWLFNIAIENHHL